MLAHPFLTLNALQAGAMGGDTAVELKERVPGSKRPPSLPDMNKHSMRTKTVVTLWLILALIQPTHALDYESASKTMSEARGKNGAVACVCPHASQVGLDILKSGGNGVDAAIAVQFALAVTWPSAGNIGGGGFMMIHPPGGKDVVCVEYQSFAADDPEHRRIRMGLPEAMRAERIHQQWFPDRFQSETHAGNIGPDTVEDLKRRGHTMEPRSPTSHHGDAHSISVDPQSGEFHAVADWRIAGKALAY